jgi:hypothetical protein
LDLGCGDSDVNLTSGNMNKKVSFSIWYVILAIWAVIVLHDFIHTLQKSRNSLTANLRPEDRFLMTKPELIEEEQVMSSCDPSAGHRGLGWSEGPG